MSQRISAAAQNAAQRPASRSRCLLRVVASCRAPAGLAAPVNGGGRWSLQDAWQLACNMRRHDREREAHAAVTNPCDMLDRNKEAGSWCHSVYQISGYWWPEWCVRQPWRPQRGRSGRLRGKKYGRVLLARRCGPAERTEHVARTARPSTLNRNASKISCIEKAGIPRRLQSVRAVLDLLAASVLQALLSKQLEGCCCPNRQVKHARSKHSPINCS